jgi:osmotically-inducible protein OsmY
MGPDWVAPEVTIMNQRNISHALWVMMIVFVTAVASASMALADSGAELMHRVNDALRTNDRLNGAKAYTASAGTVILYGTVFNDKDRALAEQTVNGVPGVHQVVDNLRTKTGKWAQEEERINTQLEMSGFTDVQARVVGPVVYISGQVTGQAAKDRAASVVSSVYPNKQINNMIWVQPGSIF